jgi:hypothetical protein
MEIDPKEFKVGRICRIEIGGESYTGRITGVTDTAITLEDVTHWYPPREDVRGIKGFLEKLFGGYETLAEVEIPWKNITRAMCWDPAPDHFALRY